MQLKLQEVLVEAAKFKLQQGLADRCQAINLEKGDDIHIVAPPNERYLTGRVRELPETPAIFVMEGRATFNEEGSHGLHYLTELLVYVAESDHAGPRLATRLRRQARAIIECLWDDAPQEKLVDPADGLTIAHHLKPVRTMPGPTSEPAGVDAWRSFYVVVFRARTFE